MAGGWLGDGSGMSGGRLGDGWTSAADVFASAAAAGVAVGCCGERLSAVAALLLSSRRPGTSRSQIPFCPLV